MLQGSVVEFNSAGVCEQDASTSPHPLVMSWSGPMVEDSHDES